MVKASFPSSDKLLFIERTGFWPGSTCMENGFAYVTFPIRFPHRTYPADPAVPEFYCIGTPRHSPPFFIPHPHGQRRETLHSFFWKCLSARVLSLPLIHWTAWRINRSQDIDELVDEWTRIPGWTPHSRRTADVASVPVVSGANGSTGRPKLSTRASGSLFLPATTSWVSLTTKLSKFAWLKPSENMVSVVVVPCGTIGAFLCS